MKIIPLISLLCSFFLWSNHPLHAQVIHIPDANFKTYLIENKAINTNGDQEIQKKEAAKFNGKIDCSEKEISDLTGIEAFVALTSLDCHYNSIYHLNISKNKALTHLNCSRNQIYALDISTNTALTYLNCENNQLDSLNLSHNINLNTLLCWDNMLPKLDLSKNTALTYLSCGNTVNSTNKLSSLNLSKNTALTYLSCDGQKIDSLNLSNNIALKYLSCKKKQYQ